MIIGPSEAIIYGENNLYDLGMNFIFPSVNKEKIEEIYNSFLEEEFESEEEYLIKFESWGDVSFDELIPGDKEYKKSLSSKLPEYAEKQLEYLSNVCFTKSFKTLLQERDLEREEHMKKFGEYLFEKGIAFAEHLPFGQSQNQNNLENKFMKDSLN